MSLWLWLICVPNKVIVHAGPHGENSATIYRSIFRPGISDGPSGVVKAWTSHEKLMNSQVLPDGIATEKVPYKCV